MKSALNSQKMNSKRNWFHCSYWMQPQKKKTKKHRWQSERNVARVCFRYGKIWFGMEKVESRPHWTEGQSKREDHE